MSSTGTYSQIPTWGYIPDFRKCIKKFTSPLTHGKIPLIEAGFTMTSVLVFCNPN